MDMLTEDRVKHKHTCHCYRNTSKLIKSYVYLC
uniref:Uncharacterized protein n=1 Tax=Arundo donax TaxID=35708 RepID=A0A0A9AL20_ARUDO